MEDYGASVCNIEIVLCPSAGSKKEVSGKVILQISMSLETPAASSSPALPWHTIKLEFKFASTHASQLNRHHHDEKSWSWLSRGREFPQDFPHNSDNAPQSCECVPCKILLVL